MATQQILMIDVSWQMYEDLLEELAEHPGWRVNYSQGFLEIMTPLLEQEFTKVMLGNLLKFLL